MPKPKSDSNLKPVLALLHPDDIDRLREMATEHGCSVSYVVRRLVTRALQTEGRLVQPQKE
jgi:hypothetical protein